MANHLTRGAMQSVPRSMLDVTEGTKLYRYPSDGRRLVENPPFRTFGNGKVRQVSELTIGVVGNRSFVRPACP